MRKWHVLALALAIVLASGVGISQTVDPSSDRIVAALNALLTAVKSQLRVSVAPPFPVPRNIPAPIASINRSIVTDGQQQISIAPANVSPKPGQTSEVINLSPNPSLQCPFIAAVNQTASTTVITNPGGKSIHVCSILLVATTAEAIGTAEGTGSACGTGTVFWDGGSGGTVSTAISSGYAAISDRIIYPMQSIGDNVCVLQSSTGNVSGHITYGIF